MNNENFYKFALITKNGEMTWGTFNYKTMSKAHEEAVNCAYGVKKYVTALIFSGIVGRCAETFCYSVNLLKV